MPGPVSKLADSGLPLPLQLRLLRGIAWTGWAQSRLRRWARQHRQIAGGPGWCRRAWWGVAAGGVVKRHLADPGRWPDALRLLDSPDWSELDAARAAGGVIVAAAHFGPPKFLMNVLAERGLPLMVWTNSADLPDWLPASTGATFLDPLVPETRAMLMVKSALHLRRGGVLLGAADIPTGARRREFERFGCRWQLSPGLPALARRLAVPSFLALARWRGNRVRIECQRLESPPDGLDEEQWEDVWLDRYWSELEDRMPTAPEDLRFLVNLDEGRFRQELGV